MENKFEIDHKMIGRNHSKKVVEEEGFLITIDIMNILILIYHILMLIFLDIPHFVYFICNN